MARPECGSSYCRADRALVDRAPAPAKGEQMSEQESGQESGQGRDGGLTRRDVVIGGGGIAAGLLGGAAAGFGIGRATEDEETAAATTEGATTAAAPPTFAKEEGTTLKVFDTELGTQVVRRRRRTSPRTSTSRPQPLRLARSSTRRLDAARSRRRDREELTLTYDELLAMPASTRRGCMECFGNGRTVNREQLGYEVEGGNWGFSDVSQGEWTYVPIREILDRVRADSERASSCSSGAASTAPTPGRPMPIEAVTERAGRHRPRLQAQRAAAAAPTTAVRCARSCPAGAAPRASSG